MFDDPKINEFDLFITSKQLARKKSRQPADNQNMSTQTETKVQSPSQDEDILKLNYPGGKDQQEGDAYMSLVCDLNVDSIDDLGYRASV